MAKEEIKQLFLENQIFNEWKDCNIKNSDFLRLKYQGLEIDFSRLYRNIINYQVKTYGTSLNGQPTTYKTKDENRRISNNAVKRIQYRRSK